MWQRPSAILSELKRNVRDLPGSAQELARYLTPTGIMGGNIGQIGQMAAQRAKELDYSTPGLPQQQRDNQNRIMRSLVPSFVEAPTRFPGGVTAGLSMGFMSPLKDIPSETIGGTVGEVVGGIKGFGAGPGKLYSVAAKPAVKAAMGALPNNPRAAMALGQLGSTMAATVPLAALSGIQSGQPMIDFNSKAPVKIPFTGHKIAELPIGGEYPEFLSSVLMSRAMFGGAKKAGEWLGKATGVTPAGKVTQAGKVAIPQKTKYKAAAVPAEPMYHGSGKPSGKAVIGKGTYLAPDPTTAARYGKVSQMTIKPGTKLVDLTDPTTMDQFMTEAMAQNPKKFMATSQSKGLDSAMGDAVRDYARSLGYDGVKGVENVFGTVVFDKGNLVTVKYATAMDALNDPSYLDKLTQAKTAIPVKTSKVNVGSLIPADRDRFARLTPYDTSMSGNQPMVVVKTPAGNVVVDGHHRLRETINAGKSSVDVQFIPAKEAIARYGNDVPKLADKLQNNLTTGRSNANIPGMKTPNQTVNNILNVAREIPTPGLEHLHGKPASAISLEDMMTAERLAKSDNIPQRDLGKEIQQVMKVVTPKETNTKIPKAQTDKYFSATKEAAKHGLTFEKEGRGAEKRLVIDLWPDESIKGKGITTNVTLNQMKRAYDDGYRIVEPSYGMWTKQGGSYMDKLVKDGYIKPTNNRGGIERYEITDLIKTYDKPSIPGVFVKTPKGQPQTIPANEAVLTRIDSLDETDFLKRPYSTKLDKWLSEPMPESTRQLVREYRALNKSFMDIKPGDHQEAELTRFKVRTTIKNILSDGVNEIPKSVVKPLVNDALMYNGVSTDKLVDHGGGEFTAKRGYFYKMDDSPGKLAEGVKQAIPNVTIIDTRDEFRPWPGSSYFTVRFRLPK